MKNLESRVTQLESLMDTDETNNVKVVFPNDGETVIEARRRNGISDGFTGKVLVISFVSVPPR